VAPVPDLARVAAALGDPVRVRILDLLAAGRREACCSPANPKAPEAVCACDVGLALGGMPPSKLAYHLRVLREAGLLRGQRRGKWVYYSIDEPIFEAYLRHVRERWLP
jgi:ArsR family transcriptional regulator, arsenate/arsenite/antimonite-responsive transcriptional repressor